MIAERPALADDGGFSQRSSHVNRTTAGRAQAPLYEEVRQTLVRKLMAGEWKPGDKLPPEPELAALFAVSIGTIRKAVDALVDDHILERRQGRGTTVKTLSAEHLYQLFFNIVDGSGRRVIPTAQLADFKRVPADTLAAEALGVAPKTPVIRIDNLRFLDGRIIILDRLILPAERFPKLDGKMFASRKSTIYGLYQDMFGLTVVRVRENIQASIADERIAGLMKIAEGKPLLMITRRAYTFDGSLVEARTRYVITDDLSYQTENGLDVEG